ncbi:hypothetical protein [Microbulbifer hainanensis]|uniref:hypothetical protein n=1 Tax=Microbulbifer hainanensis TaxID=2735675 RepID=UPI001866F7E8|nr:hypothetical protein [Microbulbifer hainanensis]
MNKFIIIAILVVSCSADASPLEYSTVVRYLKASGMYNHELGTYEYITEFTSSKISDFGRKNMTMAGYPEEKILAYEVAISKYTPKIKLDFLRRLKK